MGDFLEPRPYTGQTLVIFLTAKHVRVPIWTFLQQASRESGSRRLATGLGELLTEDKIPRVSDERLLNQRWLEGSPLQRDPLEPAASPSVHVVPLPALMRSLFISPSLVQKGEGKSSSNPPLSTNW